MAEQDWRPWAHNEGRIRPSFIAADPESALPLDGRTTRVEFDPPSLRRFPHQNIRPPSTTTRVEFDPPSLRQSGDVPGWSTPRGNEGRIRPSFIAARPLRAASSAAAVQRGSNSTLLHCGMDTIEGSRRVVRQRGSNSTLLHCGTFADKAALANERQRGSNSTLLHCGAHEAGNKLVAELQRGSNSTLLHCGGQALPLPIRQREQRGSNSTLLHCGEIIRVTTTVNEYNEGRIRPSFIAALRSALKPSTRPSNEGRIRPSFIAARLSPARRSAGRSNEGRIRPSFIAAGDKICHLQDEGQRGSNSTLLHCGSFDSRSCRW